MVFLRFMQWNFKYDDSVFWQQWTCSVWIVHKFKYALLKKEKESVQQFCLFICMLFFSLCFKTDILGIPALNFVCQISNSASKHIESDGECVNETISRQVTVFSHSNSSNQARCITCALALVLDFKLMGCSILFENRSVFCRHHQVNQWIYFIFFFFVNPLMSYFKFIQHAHQALLVSFNQWNAISFAF